MTTKKKAVLDFLVTSTPEKDSAVKGPDGGNVRAGEAGRKPSPTKWHEKCIPGYGADSKTKSKKKPKKNYPNEVVTFVEGLQNPSEEGCQKSRKPLCDTKRKSPRYSTEVRFLEHKFIQCNVRLDEKDAEVFLPEEIRPLLINITFLLHELKPDSDARNQSLCGLISKITTLLMEISRRPIRKSGEVCDQVNAFDEVSEKLMAVLREHNGPDEEKYEKLVREVNSLQEELVQKDSEVNYVKEQIKEERARMMSDSASLDDCLRNSILKNESLKAEIKQNKAQLRKYKKILSQKEELKQKSMLELNNLRRKFAKLEQSAQQGTKANAARFPHTDADVLHGGSLTKFIKSKIVKDKKAKPKTTKTKPNAVRTTVYRNK